MQIDTRNILFICGGAFDGLDKIIARRIGKQQVGFKVDQAVSQIDDMNALLHQVQSEDLLEYGLIPEMIGRLPVVTVLDELSDEAMLQILTEPKNSLIRQYQKVFQMEGIELEMTPEALKAVVKIARKRKTGARALRGILRGEDAGDHVRSPILPQCRQDHCHRRMHHRQRPANHRAQHEVGQAERVIPTSGKSPQHVERTTESLQYNGIQYSASNATRDDKERANLGLVSPMADDKACPTLGLASRPVFSTLPPAEVDLTT